MKRTTKETARPRRVADKLSIGVIPIVAAENTIIASFIPRFPGVIERIIPRDEIEVKNIA